MLLFRWIADVGWLHQISDFDYFEFWIGFRFRNSDFGFSSHSKYRKSILAINDWQISVQACRFAPAWSWDGGKIALARTSGGSPGIYVMNPDGSGQSRLVAGGTAPAWSSDGRMIVYEYTETFGNLWALELPPAFLPEERLD